jgi:hypothetical protein
MGFTSAVNLYTQLAPSTSAVTRVKSAQELGLTAHQRDCQSRESVRRADVRTPRI